MKTTKYIGLAAGVLISLASCNINYDPVSYISEQNYYETDAQINTGVLSAYSALHDVMYYEWAFAELRADNTRWDKNTSSDLGDFEKVDQGTLTTDITYISTYWENSYAAIYNCNQVLEYIDNVEDPDLKNQYHAELLFLRAHNYFNLIRLWGPVFLVDSTISTEVALGMQRSPVSDIYDLIEGDLEMIVDNDMLPESMEADDLGRADMLAAKSMLAKIYMTHYDVGDEQYLRAISLLQDVVDAKGGDAMELVAYDQIFNINNEMNDEIIFAIRYKAGGLGLGSPFGNLFAPDYSDGSVITGTCKAYNYPTDEIIDLFVDGDVRKDVSLQENYTNVITGELITTAPCAYINKYMNAVTTEYDGEADWPVIRVADVLLLLAEALNETYGPTADAFKYLNMVRTRAGLDSKSSADYPLRYDLREAIREERRIELAFENQRFFDLLRWGIGAEVISAHFESEVFYAGYETIVSDLEDWQLLLPIPTAVLNTNPSVAQNVGY